MPKPTTADEYISNYPKNTQVHLKKLRGLIKKTAPEAVESISYGMVGYKFLKKPLIYFAGWEKHVGIYATPAANKVFTKELEKYVHGKGSVQFPVNKPLPVSLITKIIKFKITEITKSKF